MSIPPPPPPAPSRDGRLRDAGFGVLGIVAVLLGIILTDLAFKDTESVFPDGGDQFEIPGPAGAPGGVLVPVDLPADAPLFDDAARVEPSGFDDDGNPVPGGGGDPGALPGTPGGEPPTEPPTDVPIGPGLIGRWLDTCADHPGPACPLGIGGLIAAIPTLDLLVYPDASTAYLPGLRCGPMYRTETIVPFVVFSTDPVFVDIEVYTPGGLYLGDVGTTTSSSEVGLWEQRPLLQRSATMASGVHHCLPFEFGSPQSEIADPDRNGSYWAQVTATTHSLPQRIVTISVPFTGTYDDQPPIWVVPRNETQAYVSVPQKAGENTIVWVYETVWKEIPGGPQGCELSDLTGSAVAQVWSDPKPIQPGSLDQKWIDAGYEYFSVWDLNLMPGSDFTMCIHRPMEGSFEEWRLLTPDGHRLDIVTGDLRIGDPFGGAQRGSLEVQIGGAAGCPRGEFWWGFFPHIDVEGPVYYGAVDNYICTSYGPFDDYIRVGLGLGTGPDILRVPMSLLKERCNQPLDLTEPVSGPRFLGNQYSWRGGLCETSVVWRMGKVCGQGGWEDILAVIAPSAFARYDPTYVWEEDECTASRHIYYSLGLGFQVEERTANNRPDHMDWGYELVTRATS